MRTCAAISAYTRDIEDLTFIVAPQLRRPLTSTVNHVPCMRVFSPTAPALKVSRSTSSRLCFFLRCMEVHSVWGIVFMQFLLSYCFLVSHVDVNPVNHIQHKRSSADILEVCTLSPCAGNKPCILIGYFYSPTKACQLGGALGNDCQICKRRVPSRLARDG